MGTRKADNHLDGPSMPHRLPRETLDMQKNHRRRNVIRFRPTVDLGSDGATVLDRRLLLSADSVKAVHAAHHTDHVQTRSHSSTAHAASSRVTPAQEINTQYAQFLAAFQAVQESYVQTFSEQSTGTVTVTATLTAPYQAGSASMQVDDAAVFGPTGVFNPEVQATALVGSVPVGQIKLLGSSGNTLAVDVTNTSTPSLATGTTLSAQIPTSGTSSAGSIFPSYITASAKQLAVKLVNYFNTLPFKLPRMFAFPHQDARSGAIQQYVYQVVAGASPNSLEQSLLAITLPQTPGGDLQIYQAAVGTAVNASRLQMLDGVQQIFDGKLQVVPSSSLNSSTSTAGSGSTSTATTGTSATT
jgi:hypothetical protein